MPNVVNGGNGLLSSVSVAYTGADDSNIFARLGQPNTGDLIVSGSITAGGDATIGDVLYVDTIEPISTTVPLYIRAPNELGGEQLNNSALVVEGGANRIDGSANQVTIATYKPLTRGTIDYGQGEQVGSLSMWGKDSSGNDTKYVDVRGVITNPINGQEESRVNFVLSKAGVGTTYLQIDTSENIVKTLSSAKLQAMGQLVALADISCNTSLQVGTTITAGGNISAGPTSSLFSRQQTIQSSTVSGGLGGVLFTVDTNNAGRINHDATNMQITGLTGTASAVQMVCNTRVAVRAVKDALDNITTTIGNSTAPETLLQNITSAETLTYQPSRMKATSAISSGSTVSFTNSAEVLTNSSVVASRTGYYQFIAQFKTDAIGTFDAGTDVITFYADISGGSLTPLIGSIHDITYTTATTFEYTFSGYAFATAGDTINLIHIDTGTFTMTNAVLFVLWNYIGPGTGLA